MAESISLTAQAAPCSKQSTRVAASVTPAIGASPTSGAAASHGSGMRIPPLQSCGGRTRVLPPCVFASVYPSRLVMNECGGTDLVSQVLPPMTLPLPTVTSPPRMVAPA